MTERQRMENLLSAFGTYTAQNHDFDIAFAEKTGFVRLILAREADHIFFPIQSFEEMLEMFFYELLCDHVFPDQTGVDFGGFESAVRAYLDNLDSDRQYAMDKLDKYIVHWMQCAYLP